LSHVTNTVAGDIVPNECHKISASSGTCSLFLLNSSNAASLVFSFKRSATYDKVRLLSSDTVASSCGSATLRALAVLWAAAICW